MSEIESLEMTPSPDLRHCHYVSVISAEKAKKEDFHDSAHSSLRRGKCQGSGKRVSTSYISVEKGSKNDFTKSKDLKWLLRARDVSYLSFGSQVVSLR